MPCPLCLLCHADGGAEPPLPFSSLIPRAAAGALAKEGEKLSAGSPKAHPKQRAPLPALAGGAMAGG